MKKKILVLAALVICLAIAATGTLAYFTTTGTAHNVITSGKIKIELVEQMRNEDGSLVPFPKEGLTGVMPGSTVSKIVQVKNDNGRDAWIRVKLDVSITGADGKPLSTSIDDTELVTFSPMTGWTAKDGYFYYTEPVATNKVTTPLLESVRFSTKMGNEYQNCTANVIVHAEAVQKDNNGTAWYEAAGWPNP